MQISWQNYIFCNYSYQLEWKEVSCEQTDREDFVGEPREMICVMDTIQICSFSIVGNTIVLEHYLYCFMLIW